MKNLIKKILKEDFSWIRDIKPEPNVGSCIVDKLDPSQTMWTIEGNRKTIGGTDIIEISNGEKNLSLNKKFFLEDYYGGRYVFCNELVNESNDFDWVKNVPDIEFGEHFTYSDLNDKIFIEKGVVTYELSFDEFNELVNDGYDDYYLKDLVLYNGTYEYGSDSDYFDDEEINYYPSYLSQEQRRRLRNALKRAAKLFNLDGSDSKIDEILSEYFWGSEDYIGGRLYSGINDWDYVTGNYLYHLSENVNLNRWRSLNQTYLNTLENNNIDVIGSRYDESVKVITDLPYKHKKTVFNPTSGVEPTVVPISDLTKILTKGLYDIFSINWEDYWWSEFDSTGTDAPVQEEFEYFIDNIEEALDELENGED
jgi:hypothetical protein